MYLQQLCELISLVFSKKCFFMFLGNRYVNHVMELIIDNRFFRTITFMKQTFVNTKVTCC